MGLYFNEIDPLACEWLGNLFPGHWVDSRGIRDVQPEDLSGHRRLHFFAGIAGWELALQLAGWPDDWEVWTGSCPCQPFSSAGKRKGTADERHLWPEFFRLINECRPDFVFGEQVKNAIGHGWLDGISADLEGAGYAVGACVLGAHSVGAPHIRQRLYWAAIADSTRWSQAMRREGQYERNELEPGRGGVVDGVANSGCELCGQGTRPRRGVDSPERCESCIDVESNGVLDGWSDYAIIPCRDGKARRVSSKSGVKPLAHGIPRSLGRGQPELSRVVRRARTNRVGRLRAHGNAIVPQLAAVFVRSVMEVMR